MLPTAGLRKFNFTSTLSTLEPEGSIESAAYPPALSANATRDEFLSGAGQCFLHSVDLSGCRIHVDVEIDV